MVIRLKSLTATSPKKDDQPSTQVAMSGQPLRLHRSPETEDAKWDEFLKSTPLGQFQQSSGWARIKNHDNWQNHRFVFSQRDQWVGGFQILCRSTRMGQIGYISKGPILLDEGDPVWGQCLESIRGLAKTLQLRALVVQPPDVSRVRAEWLLREGFQHERFLHLIDASLWFDLEGAPESIMQRMPGYNRTFIRQAMRKGVAIREGGESDLPEFFELMIQTCRRQGTIPNPPSLEAVKRVWEVLHRSNAIRLAFADYRGRALAALTSISFGKRMTLWKKGWANELGNLRPNHLLYYDALCWGQRSGFKFCDFYSVDRRIAEALLQKKMMTNQQSRSRDRFHLGFGGRPVLLPEAFIHFADPLLRVLYSLANRKLARGFSELVRRAKVHPPFRAHLRELS